MRVNCREQIANPAEPVNSQDERRKCAAVDSPARLCCSIIKRATAQDLSLIHIYELSMFTRDEIKKAVSELNGRKFLLQVGMYTETLWTRTQKADHETGAADNK